MERRRGWLKFGVGSQLVGIPRLLPPSPFSFFLKKHKKQKINH